MLKFDASTVKLRVFEIYEMSDMCDALRLGGYMFPEQSAGR